MQRFRFILFVSVFLALMAVLLSGYGYYRTSRQLAEERLHDAARAKVEVVAERISYHMDRHRLLVASLARFQGLDAYLADRASAEAVQQANDLLQSLAGSMGLETCYLLNRQGTVVASSNSSAPDSFVGHNYSFRPYFTLAMQGHTVVYPALSVTSDRLGIYFSHPVYGQEGRSGSPLGVLVLKDDPDHIQRELADHSDGNFYLVDPHNLVFASSRPGEVLHFLLPPKDVDLEKLRDSLQFGVGPWPVLPYQQAGGGVFIDDDGRRFLVHQAKVEGFPGWRLLFLHDLGTVAEEVFNPAFKGALLSLGLLFLGVLSISLVLFRRAEQEIRRRQEAESALAEKGGFLEAVIESIPFPLYVVDARTHRVVLGNYHALHGLPPGTATCYQLTHQRETPCSDDEDTHPCPLRQVVRTGLPAVVEHLHHDSKSGEERIVEVHGFPMFDAEGEVTKMIETSVDVTEQRWLQRKLEKISITDELTGLLNRRGFLRFAEKQLAVVKREEGCFYLLYADLDGMKEINDSLGHLWGDQALVKTAEFLRRTFRESDIIGRLGGDEFVVLLTGCGEEDTSERVRERFHAGLEEFNRVSGLPFSLAISVGVVRYDHDHPPTLDQLISRADARMYEEKRRKQGA